MSLNGLDDVKVKEAHEAVVAEAGGWFLLKYASRDEVEILAKGSGGVAEMRANIEQYEEESPLFGFLRYRRRNVLLKYMPEGCSRLIQARSTVHFNAVCERFGPCETTIDITDGKDLSEVKLSNACSLHTASASTSSSHSSLRRRRLVEIAEEGEEEDQRETKRQSVVEGQDQPGEIENVPARPRSPITGPPVTLDPTLATSPKDSTFANTAEPPSFSGLPRPASPAKSFDNDLQRRMSTQSSRHDYYSNSSYLYSKPRVRLGPRPFNEPAGRPRSSAGGGGGDTVRPVAAMPAGFRLGLKGGKRTKTHDDSSSITSQDPPDHNLLAPIASIPENSALSLRPRTSEGARPTTSSGISVKSLSAISQPVKQSMTPEKLRLMKALQLREKKRRASAVPETTVPSVEITPSGAGEQPDKQQQEEEELKSNNNNNNNQNAAVLDDTEARQHSMQDSTGGGSSSSSEDKPAADQMSVSKADSAIDVASTAPTDHTSEHTQTDSRPPTPNGASSEVGDSTQASSVSESTDETVHPQGEKAEYGEEEGEGAEMQQQQQQQQHKTSDEATATTASLATQMEEQQLKEFARDEEKHSDARPAQQMSDAENNFVPTSKFAAKLPSGQAAMDPLDSRGQAPLNVTSEPGRIDEADPSHVEPLERTEDGPAATASTKWNLPISKYSTIDSTKCLAPSPIPVIDTSPVESSSSSGQVRPADEPDKMVDDGATDENKRSGPPEPLLMDSAVPPAKEAPPQETETVAVEPQPATHESEDPTMIHSPVTETPPQPSEPPTPRILRTVSSPVHSPYSAAGDAPPHSARSISSGSLAFQQRTSQQQQQPPAAHLTPRGAPGKLSGGISSRIKAFEQLATKSPTAVPVNTGATGRPSSAFFSIRQNSVRDGARSPSVLERTNSIYRGRTPTTPAESLDGSPESIIKPSRERSGSVASRLSVFEGGSAPRGKPETVQVTAKIVRDPGQNYPRAPGSQADAAEYSSLDLKQSPLIVDHRKSVDVSELVTPAADAPPVPTPLVHAGEPRKSLHERRLSRDSKNVSPEDSRDGLHRPGQRTSLTMARDFIRDSMAGKDSPNQARPPSVHQSGSLLSRLSINTRRKSISQDPTLLSPTATEKSESGDENRGKEGNRASRLMRRLSSTFSPGRKQSTPTMTSPTLAEELDAEKALPAQTVTAPATPGLSNMVAFMGDVNVQFPENLLWKRRTMSMDASGFLHLTPAQGAVSAREKQLKRFHMSEFKPPYTPEIEFQELPNSVCLDLKSGSGLQVAFQDRAGQLNGLQVLQDAHEKHTSFGQ